MPNLRIYLLKKYVISLQKFDYYCQCVAQNASADRFHGLSASNMPLFGQAIVIGLSHPCIYSSRIISSVYFPTALRDHFKYIVINIASLASNVLFSKRL